MQRSSIIEAIGSVSALKYSADMFVVATQPVIARSAALCLCSRVNSVDGDIVSLLYNCVVFIVIRNCTSCVVRLCIVIVIV